jgi:hypothetical protein
MRRLREIAGRSEHPDGELSRVEDVLKLLFERADHDTEQKP